MLNYSHTSQLELWQQKQNLLDQLLQIANISITSTSRRRERLEKQFTDFIFQQPKDSLYGGFLSKRADKPETYSSDLFHKPLITNIYLSELLLAADQVFYRGYFSFIAKQIVEDLIGQISDSGSMIIEINQYFEYKKLACFFSHATLKDLLNDKENQLLLALTSPDSAQNNNMDGFLISYTRSLRDASAKIDMHYKEAQIVEFGLLDKLRKKGKKELVFFTSELQEYFAVNCEILVLLSKSLLNDYQPSTAMLTKNIFHGLYKRLTNSSKNRRSLVNLIYAGIILLQVEFDLELVATVDRLTLQLSEQPNTEEQCEKSKIQEIVITLFSQRNSLQSISATMQMLFLSKEQVDFDLRLTELKAQFNPNRLVFVV